MKSFGWAACAGCCRNPFDATLIARTPPPLVDNAAQSSRSLGIRTAKRSANPVAELPLRPLPSSSPGRPSSPPISSPAADGDPTPSGVAQYLPLPLPRTHAALLIVQGLRRTNPLLPVPVADTETLLVSEPYPTPTSELVLVAKEPAVGASDDEAIATFETEKKTFGFSWFIPELLKHRTIWRDILLASLAIQLRRSGNPIVYPSHHRQGGHSSNPQAP